MQISYQWLRQFCDFTQTPDEISKILTSIGLEVEFLEPFETIKGGLKGLVIGTVLTCEKHPNADKLSKTTVDVGNNTILPIVCGAPNVAAGQKVIVALVGTNVYPLEGEPFTIKKAKIRDEVSEGMICAEDEIGLGKSHDGIMVLDTDLANGTPASQYFGVENDFIFTIGLTPNRADAASHLGVARDLYAAIAEQNNVGLTFFRPDVKNFASTKTKANIGISIENETACPRYAGVLIEDIKVENSPKWLQNRLKSIGLKPINNIVDITNYILHELGQPLHAFDADKIKGNQIIVKNVAQDTEFITLDEKTRKLNATDLLICDTESPLCIAGVFGGLHSGITETSTRVFLESAYFSPESVRKTSQLHGLKTDASFRFERGTDPNMVIFALKRAALLIQDIAGGKIVSEITDVYPNPIENFKFPISFKNIETLSGLKLAKDKIYSILESLEINIFDETVTGFIVSVPPYRVDVQREADIIEEIIRINGLDAIPVAPYLGATYLADFPTIGTHKINNQVSEKLAAQGFHELVNNSLTKPVYAENLASVKENSNVSILNKLSEDLGVMRQSLLFGGLESIAYNINRKQKDLKLFEIGKTYHLTGDAAVDKGYKENTVLALFITGNVSSESWKSKNEATSYYDLAASVENLLQSLRIQGYTKTAITEPASDIFAQGISLTKNNKVIASFGQVKSKLTQLVDIKQPVFYAEIALDAIYKLVNNTIVFQEISKFPEVRRDLSLVLDKNVTFDDIQKLAYQLERKTLKNINVFDVYEGDKLEKGKKAYAISLLLQDENLTLTDKQIETTMKVLMDGFESKLGALIRK